MYYNPPMAMDKLTQTHFNNMWSEDRELQNKAFLHILKVTDKPVDWAYEAWNDLVNNLSHKDNHNRAIAAQVLCDLAKSDPKNRMLKDLDALISLTKDERFVTARHCMQSLWKVGTAGKKQQQKLMDGLEFRFKECINEKNCTLIRYDILQSLRNVYDKVKDEKIRAKALELIDTEDDLKYRKKYLTLWKVK
ncbi:MAG TPA: hypothetical protein VFI68_14715 [Anaerolineales bacterium]|nr:hypothetical protein [Anaerolineales bacterium]